MRSYRYLHLDVFTDHVFGGNQLAVFPEPQGLTPAEMQAITREMAYSESTFVFPAEDPRTDVRVRIFTPGREMPMAGHPTIGTAFALASEGVFEPGCPKTVFGLGIGPTDVALAWKDGRLAFAWMTQRLPAFAALDDAVEPVARALGVAPDAIRATGQPIEEVSCGVPFLFVPLASRADVDAAVLDQAALTRFYAARGLDEDLGVFLFTTQKAVGAAEASRYEDRAVGAAEAGRYEDRTDVTAYSRMFAPGLGVAEDPATGAASGPLGCYLVKHGLVASDRADRIVSRQGVKMSRPSDVHIRIGLERGTITSVQVGGQAVVVGEGSLNV